MTWDKLGAKITEEYDNFHSRKYIQKVRLRSGDHVVQADHFTFSFPVIEPYIEKRSTQRPFGSISQMAGRSLILEDITYIFFLAAVQPQVSGYWFSVSCCSYLVLNCIFYFIASRDPACHAYSLVSLYSIPPLINSCRPLRRKEQLSTQNEVRATVPWPSTKKTTKCPVSISDKTSYRKISRSLQSLTLVI